MKIFLTLTLLLLTTTLFSKSSDYSLIINKPFNNQLLNIDQDYDRSISAVGFIKNYKTSSNNSQTYTSAFDYLESVSNSYGTQMQIIKADAGANITIDKSSSLSNLD